MKKRDEGNIYIYYFTYLLFYTYWSFYIVEMLRYIKKRDEAADLQRVRMEQKLDALIAWQKASMAVDEESGDFGFPFSSDEQFKEFERSLEGNEDKKIGKDFFLLI